MAKSWDEYRLGDPYEPPRRKGLKTVVIIAALMAITILPAMAAKGGNGTAGGGKGHGGSTGGSTSGGSLTLKMVNDLNNNGSPNWGDTITFDIQQSTTATPNVNVTCYQNGGLVYGAMAGFYDGYPWPWTVNMKLSSQSWTGGAADCTADLNYYAGSKTISLATLNFHVAG